MLVSFVPCSGHTFVRLIPDTSIGFAPPVETEDFSTAFVDSFHFEQQFPIVSLCSYTNVDKFLLLACHAIWLNFSGSLVILYTSLSFLNHNKLKKRGLEPSMLWFDSVFMSSLKVIGFYFILNHWCYIYGCLQLDFPLRLEILEM